MFYTANKVILHADLDKFYASVAQAENPSLKNKCIAVCGDVENRHGIILTASKEAKVLGVKTGEAIWEAQAKCRDLILVKADYKAYKFYSHLVRNIYFKYTDKVEAFGLDENWLDVTDSTNLFGDGLTIAKKIQQEVLEQTGLTVSIGIGWNKVIAKFGSDLNKPFGITNITIANFEDVFWKAPVEDLLYVGRKTKEKYNQWGIMTIGDLAKDTHFIQLHGNKVDKIIQYWSQGYCTDEVHNLFEVEEPVKSVGNSITSPKDLEDINDCSLVYQILCESVATRLKHINKQGCVISIYLRKNDLTGFSKQKKIPYYTNISSEIHKEVMRLVRDYYDFSIPLRSIGLKVSSLREDSTIIQHDLFGYEMQRLEEKTLDKTIDAIRAKFGHQLIKKASSLLDESLTSFNPLADLNTVHPVAYFKRGIEL